MCNLTRHVCTQMLPLELYEITKRENRGGGTQHVNHMSNGKHPGPTYSSFLSPPIREYYRHCRKQFPCSPLHSIRASLAGFTKRGGNTPRSSARRAQRHPRRWLHLRAFCELLLLFDNNELRVYCHIATLI
jgi:hypothetical protein